MYEDHDKDNFAQRAALSHSFMDTDILTYEILTRDGNFPQYIYILKVKSISCYCNYRLEDCRGPD